MTGFSAGSPANPGAKRAQALRLALGSDHGGFALKRWLARTLAEMGHTVIDCGCDSPEPVDYPDIALKVGSALLDGRAQAGIMIDAAGIGSTMVLNRIPGIRAALCHDPMTTVNSRAHNDANVLVLGSRVVHPGEASRLVRLWLATDYEGGRHERRVGKIRALDRERGGP
jgi:RpiB/LacA/LacB family sugar-phosphate isomerase